MKIFFVFAFLFIFAAASCQRSQEKKSYNPYNYAPVKRIVVKHAAVASAHILASDVGKMILKKGGNAIDAAVAMQFALAVVYPEAGNIGGGGFAVIHLANGKNTSIVYREKAPGKSTRNMFVGEDGRTNRNLLYYGCLASGVPGTVAGIFKMHKEYGKLPMKELIQPAIDLAEHGFVITTREAERLNDRQEVFEKYNTVMPVFVKRKGWHAGDTLVQKDLAQTLELIRDQGKSGFYEGETAHKIFAEMNRGNGIISLEDLKNYKADESAPISFDYKGYHIISMPPPSSGGVLLAEMLGMLKHFPIEQYGFESVHSVQLMTEIERRAFADRVKYVGDPNFVKVPLKTMMSDAYLQKRIADYQSDKATSSKEIRPGIIENESNETTHLSVVDSSGNAVAVTFTLSDSYGSKVVVGHAGFFLNGEMRGFVSNPGNEPTNDAIEPHKRMLSSMSPTIVLKENSPYLVLGSIGSRTIITSVFQTIVDLLDFNISVSDAVNKPKFHMQWEPDLIYIEKGFPDSVRQAMEPMGYTFEVRAPIGRTEVIKIAKDSVIAVGDHRGDDGVAGY